MADTDSSLRVRVHQSIHAISPQAWDALTDGTPLLSHAFLSALETSQSVGAGTGWMPHPLAVYDASGQLVGTMPLYLKSHSYGEYVFDWAWAEAYQQHQLSYYPKLVCAIPFSPITSARLLTQDSTVAETMLAALASIVQQGALSSVHALFPTPTDEAYFAQAGWIKRTGVQFRWQNQHYADFEAFLATLNHNKRKKIHQERKKLAASGVQYQWLLGTDITESDWDFFYQCYCNTYAAHHSTPYLTRQFFSAIGQSMAEQLLLIVAKLEDKPIAAALNFYNDHTLYGRYWGALHYLPNLHFELCYYQAQDFCIQHGVKYFEGGAQGEHKLARGFEPRPTCSYHLIANPDFATAIEAYTKRESMHIAHYTNELEERTPFKQSP
jgi:uncharacterized protein